MLAYLSFDDSFKGPLSLKRLLDILKFVNEYRKLCDKYDLVLDSFDDITIQTKSLLADGDEIDIVLDDSFLSYVNDKKEMDNLTIKELTSKFITLDELISKLENKETK